MNYIDNLRTTIARATPLLLGIPAEVNSRRPAPGKWSAKEILGHLVDSAANNHQRFVRAQWQAELVFSGYDQEAWVRAEGYQEAPWNEIVALWAAYNTQLARLMATIPSSVRLREHQRHNLHELAWRPIPADRPATLDYLMEDYVAHLHHHLTQIGALVGVAAL
jgi:hypothetical protein